MRLFRKQSNRLKWTETTYEEVRCFIGLLMWTSLVRMPNRRSYFTDSKIYNLPHFKAHTTCKNRFQQLFTMLHFTNNNQISATLNTAQRFEVKLSNLLTAVNKTPTSLPPHVDRFVRMLDFTDWTILHNCSIRKCTSHWPPCNELENNMKFCPSIRNPMSALRMSEFL